MQGMPYALVMLVSAILLKQFNFTNSKITFYTSLFTLPWVLKFSFAGFLENISTKKSLIVNSEYGIALIIFLIGLLIFFNSFAIAIMGFFLIAFLSSWHDIAADGYYLVQLNRKQQIQYVPIRTLAFQAARFFCQGGMVIAIGWMAQKTSLNFSWMLGFFLLAFLILIIALYHQFILTSEEILKVKTKSILFIFREFFNQSQIVPILLFIFFYNVAEAQLIKVVPLFLLDSNSVGGLNYSITQVGFIYGTLGLISMLVGVLLSGEIIKRFGIKKPLIIFTAIFLISLVGYALLSAHLISNIFWVAIVIGLTQFCFGLSNNAFMTCLVDRAREHAYSMSFYAIFTGIMAFGMMIPGAISGYLQQYLGYWNFFNWILILQMAVWFFTIYIATSVLDEYSRT